jgi:hypothetical protein
MISSGGAGATSPLNRCSYNPQLHTVNDFSLHASRVPIVKGGFYFRVLTLLLLALIFGFTAYRAALQAITHDEALTYMWFLDGGIGKILTFDANNHFLFTALAKVIVKTFGLTELSLRVASLLGCAVYLTACFLLCQRLFGDSVLLPATVAWLVLNPTVTDFLVAARGYSLGLAFLTLAMYYLADASGRGNLNLEDPFCRRQCAIASLLLALSVAANLTNAVPATSLALSFLAIALWLAPKRAGRFRDSLRAFAQCSVMPGVGAGLFLLWPFLIQMRPYQFYVGHLRIVDSVRDVFNASFLYKWTDDTYTCLGAVPSPPGSWQQRVSDIGIYAIVPALLLFLLSGIFFLSSHARKSASYPRSSTIFFATSSLGCVGLIVLLHVLLHVKYPLARTGLYLIPLFSVSVILMGRDLILAFRRPVLAAVGWILVISVVVGYLASLHGSYFRHSAYDARSRELFLKISEDAQSRHLAAVRVGGTWWYEPVIKFYRQRYKADWMLPYDVKDPSYLFQTENSLTPGDYDYFVFTRANQPDLRGYNVRIIFRDDLLGLSIVAVAHNRLGK